ncbi:hypothetical protein HGI30_18410 [Paenibacillus albicereus]|uniref:Uncharacterized protein n=1 Tax=Paenibacillus albicereus TaxID=2726185 RepID=A0A6H2H122_9BACL|nr:hypothetical protein [Paenibacillus albicereus]QJC53352.1 hypothetical protein HGI30_18410 [Paenibacillus albicereus]
MKKITLLLSSTLVASSLFTGSYVSSAYPSITTTETSLSSFTASETRLSSFLLVKPPVISPQALLLGETKTFDGQGSSGFIFNKASSKVRIYVKNWSSKPVDLKLISPQGYNWLDRRLTTSGDGSKIETTVDWGTAQNGNWSFTYVTTDGSQGKIELAVRDDV